MRSAGELTRGYAPRGYVKGDQLHAWAHGPAGVYTPGRLKCDGSYKEGFNSRLDADLESAKGDL